jgi:NAD-dependent SIR2 family protein deacetylase
MPDKIREPVYCKRCGKEVTPDAWDSFFSSEFFCSKCEAVYRIYGCGCLFVSGLLILVSSSFFMNILKKMTVFFEWIAK